MGVIAFVRQAFLDAQHYRLLSTGEQTAARQAHYEPALEAMQPAMAGRMPVAFAASRRARSARARHGEEFKLDPIITGAREADSVTAGPQGGQRASDLQPELPHRRPSLAPDADEPLQRAARPRQCAEGGRPRSIKAGVLFAFESAGLRGPRTS